MQSKKQQVFDAIKTHFDRIKRRVRFVSYRTVSLWKVTTQFVLVNVSRANKKALNRLVKYLIISESPIGRRVSSVHA